MATGSRVKAARRNIVDRSEMTRAELARAVGSRYGAGMEPTAKRRKPHLFHLVRAHQMPTRLVAGAFILNSGISKRHPGETQLQGVHGMATVAYPQFKRLRPEQFVKLLSTSEILLGSALLTPLVPSVLAGAGLSVFAGALVGLYLRTPGARQQGSLRPTRSGLPLAKDAWLLGMGLSLVAEGLEEMIAASK